MAAMLSVPINGGVSGRMQSYYVSSLRCLPVFMADMPSCRCNAQFCYVCGLKWKTCQCPQWDEARLYSRATEIVNRNPQPLPRQGQPQVIPRARQVEQAAQRLRERHECDHHGAWRRLEGRFRCEDCRSILPKFILECRRCQLQSCVRCKYNRGFLRM